MKSVVCISDTHEMSRDHRSHALFPGYIDSLSAEERQEKYSMFVSTVSECHRQVLAFLKNQRLWDVLFHFGDVTGGWNEQGLAAPELFEIARQTLVSYRSMTSQVCICWGNHDTGYGHTIGDLSLESVETCRMLS